MEEFEIKIYMLSDKSIIVCKEFAEDKIEEVLVAVPQMRGQQLNVALIPIGAPIIDDFLIWTKEELGVVKALDNFKNKKSLLEAYEKTVYNLKHPDLILNGKLPEKTPPKKNNGIVLK